MSVSQPIQFGHQNLARTIWSRAGRSDALHSIAGRLAHDLNNPLMIVTGYAEEMKNTLREDDPMRADVDQILTASDRISGIAAQLLHYTRRQANPAVPVNVTRALVRMEDKIAHAAGCALHLSLGNDAWAIAEQSQLEEIVLALLSYEREDARERSRVTIGCDTDIPNQYGLVSQAGGEELTIWRKGQRRNI